ncbi:MAG: hypothetical protein WDA71_12360 [Actinomycetota bacterium]
MPKSIRRWRLMTGAALLLGAVVAAIVGYLKISTEPSVAHQVPYLASAGLATLILAVVGGALLMADQIRAEDDRVEEIERSLVRMAEVVAPAVEQQARIAVPVRSDDEAGIAKPKDEGEWAPGTSVKTTPARPRKRTIPPATRRH